MELIINEFTLQEFLNKKDIDNENNLSNSLVFDKKEKLDINVKKSHQKSKSQEVIFSFKKYVNKNSNSINIIDANRNFKDSNNFALDDGNRIVHSSKQVNIL